MTNARVHLIPVLFRAELGFWQDFLFSVDHAVLSMPVVDVIQQGMYGFEGC